MTLTKMAFPSRVPAPASTPEPKSGEWFAVEHPASATGKTCWRRDVQWGEETLLLGYMWT